MVTLGPEGSRAIVFQKVVYRIPSGTLLGEARVGRRGLTDEIRWSRSSAESNEFNVGVTDGFRELGYTMRDSADAVFDASNTIKVRYELAGILHRAAVDYEYEYDRRNYRAGEGVGIADVEVEVRLLDRWSGRTVYTRRFKGHGVDHGREPNPIPKSVVDAITKSAADQEFVDIVSNVEEPTVDPASVDKTDVAICDDGGQFALPGSIGEVLKSVVEVQAGGAIGSGVFISPNGWIITANHVTDGAPEISVRLRNGIRLPAKLYKSRYQSDVSLLRVAGSGFPCTRPRRPVEDLDLGSDLFVVNAAVEARGNPTVARGVVGGYTELDSLRLLQTDASLNPGSSGGPAFDLEGRVAGIVVGKAVGVAIEGQGFAVPIDRVLRDLAIALKNP